MLAQQSVLYPGTVRNNLNIGAAFQNRPDFSDDLLTEILKRTYLGEKSLDENPELFSGGEKQRLALARVLLLEPSVLLLDEPGSALDQKTETHIMDLICEDQGKRHTTCVLITHSEEMAKKYADVIIYMESGKIVRVVSKTGDIPMVDPLTTTPPIETL